MLLAASSCRDTVFMFPGLAAVGMGGRLNLLCILVLKTEWYMLQRDKDDTQNWKLQHEG